MENDRAIFAGNSGYPVDCLLTRTWFGINNHIKTGYYGLGWLHAPTIAQHFSG